MVYDWAVAEQHVVDWMQSHGYPDARLTRLGADEGVDVRATGAVAQVKAHTRGSVGRPDLQRIYGIAAAEGVKGLFFSLSGYSSEASVWARKHGLPLFVLQPDGEVEPYNPDAQEIADHTDERFFKPSEPTTAPAVDHVLDSLHRSDSRNLRTLAQHLPEILEEREQIRGVGVAQSGVTLGLLIVTSRRMVWLFRTWRREKYGVESFDFADMKQMKDTRRDALKFRAKGDKRKFSFASKRYREEVLRGLSEARW